MVTPGTIVEPGLLHGDRNNYLVAHRLAGRSGRPGVCGYHHRRICRDRDQRPDVAASLRAELMRLNPAEILLPEGWPCRKARPAI